MAGRARARRRSTPRRSLAAVPGARRRSRTCGTRSVARAARRPPRRAPTPWRSPARPLERGRGRRAASSSRTAPTRSRRRRCCATSCTAATEPIVLTGAIRPSSAARRRRAREPARRRRGGRRAADRGPRRARRASPASCTPRAPCARSSRPRPRAFGSPRGRPARPRRRGARADRRAAACARRRSPCPSALDARVPIVPTFLGDDGAGLRAALRDGADGDRASSRSAPGTSRPPVLARAARGGRRGAGRASRCGPSAALLLRETYGFEGCEGDVRAHAARCAAGSLSPRAARMILLAGARAAARPRARARRPRSTGDPSPRGAALYACRRSRDQCSGRTPRRVKQDRVGHPPELTARIRVAGSASEEVTATPDLELKLPARAENVAVVRHAFGGFAEVLSVDEQTLADIKLAVTEACTNVVIHAYDADAPASLEVDASFDDERLTVVIRDSGRGIVPRPDSPGPRPRPAAHRHARRVARARHRRRRPHRGAHDLPPRRGGRGGVSVDPGAQRGIGRPGARPAGRPGARARRRDARRARRLPDRPARRRAAHRRRRRRAGRDRSPSTAA